MPYQSAKIRTRPLWLALVLFGYFHPSLSTANTISIDPESDKQSSSKEQSASLSPDHASISFPRSYASASPYSSAILTGHQQITQEKLQLILADLERLYSFNPACKVGGTNEDPASDNLLTLFSYICSFAGVNDAINCSAATIIEAIKNANRLSLIGHTQSLDHCSKLFSLLDAPAGSNRDVGSPELCINIQNCFEQISQHQKRYLTANPAVVVPQVASGKAHSKTISSKNAISTDWISRTPELLSQLEIALREKELGGNPNANCDLDYDVFMNMKEICQMVGLHEPRACLAGLLLDKLTKYFFMDKDLPMEKRDCQRCWSAYSSSSQMEDKASSGQTDETHSLRVAVKLEHVCEFANCCAREFLRHTYPELELEE